MSKKLTFERVKNFIEIESNSGCELLSTEYNGKRENLIIQCKCGKCFTTSYDSFKYNNKRSCDECGINARVDKQKLSIDFVREYISNLGYQLISNEYINAHEKIKIKCNHGHVFERTFNELNKHQSCPFCTWGRASRVKSQDDFIKDVYKLYVNEYTIIGDYINSETKIRIKHNVCNNEFDVMPNSLIQGHGCKYCNHQSYKKTNEEFKQEVFDLVGDEYTILSHYKNNNTHIFIKHNECSHEYYVTPSNFLRGRRCPYCNESKGERGVRKILENNNINFQTQYMFKDLLSDLGNPLRFDFAILDNNELKYLIEYDGEFHYEKLYDNDNFEILKYHDELKNEYCKINNIKLIRIPYWEYDNISKILKDEFHII
jgi:hypothetical protein